MVQSDTAIDGNTHTDIQEDVDPDVLSGMYVCVRVYGMCVCAYACGICVCACACTNASIHVCVCVRAHVCVCVMWHVCMYT